MIISRCHTITGYALIERRLFRFNFSRLPDIGDDFVRFILNVGPLHLSWSIVRDMEDGGKIGIKIAYSKKALQQ